MYFLWKRTPHGSIRVSCGGLSAFINRILPGKSRCCSLSLTEGESASVTLVLYPDGSEDTLRVEERIAVVVAPMGFRVQCVWMDRSVSETEWREALASFYHSPWAWMCIVGVTALGIISGLKGLFWTFFWGTTAWFVSKGLISFLDKRKKMNFVFPQARR